MLNLMQDDEQLPERIALYIRELLMHKFSMAILDHRMLILMKAVAAKELNKLNYGHFVLDISEDPADLSSGILNLNFRKIHDVKI